MFEGNSPRALSGFNIYMAVFLTENNDAISDSFIFKSKSNIIYYIKANEIKIAEGEMESILFQLKCYFY